MARHWFQPRAAAIALLVVSASTPLLAGVSAAPGAANRSSERKADGRSVVDQKGGAVEERGKSFKLMTYNIRHGSGMDGRWNLWRTAEVLRKSAPDVVALQEVDRGTGRSHRADEPSMLVCLLDPVLRFSRFSKSIDFDGGGYGNAILSREEPLSTKTIPLPGDESRSFLLCEFESCFVGTAHLALKERKALESVPLIVEAVKGAGKPVFLTGDWNVEPDSPVITALEKDFVILSPTTTPTWPADKPSVCIDYIAIDRAHADKVKVRSAGVGDDRVASDHLPVVLSCEIAP